MHAYELAICEVTTSNFLRGDILKGYRVHATSTRASRYRIVKPVISVYWPSRVVRSYLISAGLCRML